MIAVESRFIEHVTSRGPLYDPGGELSGQGRVEAHVTVL
jgi:hypothetical protein